MEQPACKLSEKVETSLNLENTADKEEEIKENIAGKNRRKLDKIIESVLKKNAQSQPINTIEDKYYALVQMFIDTQEQNKKLQITNKENEKTIANLTKQRDQAQSDFSKMLLAKDKLENLCRELQKHNKLIKDENLHRIKEEEEKRKEISNKFQLAIDDINQQMSTNTDRNNTLIQENASLTSKLKSLLEQYEKREEHVEKILKHKDLEVELANAKLQQSDLRLAESEERNKTEKKLFETHATELIKKCEFHQEAEKQLRAQLGTYTEKYEEFQNTLKKSNQVFESFKSEMDKMTKKMKKLEQDTQSWKNKWENCDKLLQNCIKIKDELDDKCKKLQAKSDAMEKLSRSLQTERNALKEQLKKYEEPTAGLQESSKETKNTEEATTNNSEDFNPTTEVNQNE